MAAGYIPLTDAACDAWSQNFSTLITASPATYGLLSADAVAIAAAVALFHNAYLIAGLSGTPPKTPLSPATRTAVTIATMQAQKAAMLALLRIYALQIRNNLGVTDTAKTNLGLTIVKVTKTPIARPVTFPILGFVAATPGVATLSMRDSATPTIRAKPFGTIGAQIITILGPTVPVGPDVGGFNSNQTKTPFQLGFAGADAGKLCYCWGRWYTRTGLLGDWSGLLTFSVPAGGT